MQTNEDTALPITLTGTDPDNDALAFTVLDAPLHGTLSGTAPDLTYTPAPGYVGADSFTFKVNDGQVDSPSARIDIEVLLVNSAPVIVSSPVTVATEAQPYQYDADATDPDNDTLAYRMRKQSASRVLASFRPSTYRKGTPRGPHSLRPCWTACLRIL